MGREIRVFLGVAGSGKDYSCKKLLEQGSWKQVAFADALRRVIFVTLGMTFEEGMARYDELKATPLYNGQTLRNMMEHLGTEGIRHYDNDFWVKCTLKDIEDTPEDINICISDLRFHNEYVKLKEFAERNDYTLKLIFCDYHSERYQEDNSHPSARLANTLKVMGIKDQQEVTDADMQEYINLVEE